MISDLPVPIQGLIWLIISLGIFFLFYVIVFLILRLYYYCKRNEINYQIVDYV